MRRPTLAFALANTLALSALPAALPAHAACDVAGARIEETIASKGELREGANAQIVRDLRTLRDAAIVLDSYKFPGECEVLLGIAKSLAKDPDTTIEQSGDTDEDRAERVAAARKPKAPAAAADAEPN